MLLTQRKQLLMRLVGRDFPCLQPLQSFDRAGRAPRAGGHRSKRKASLYRSKPSRDWLKIEKTAHADVGPPRAVEGFPAALMMGYCLGLKQRAATHKPEGHYVHEQALKFLDQWVSEHVNADAIPKGQSHAEVLAAQCLKDAAEQGISEDDVLVAAGSDLVDYMYAAMESAIMAEVDRFSKGD